MKRFTFSAVACAVLALGSSNLALADKGDKNDHQGNGHKVTMCSRALNIEITVKVKDVAEHLAQGDTLGSCPVTQEYPQ